jgi:hypothetical protein
MPGTRLSMYSQEIKCIELLKKGFISGKNIQESVTSSPAVAGLCYYFNVFTNHQWYD